MVHRHLMDTQYIVMALVGYQREKQVNWNWSKECVSCQQSWRDRRRKGYVWCVWMQGEKWFLNPVTTIVCVRCVQTLWLPKCAQCAGRGSSELKGSIKLSNT